MRIFENNRQLDAAIKSGDFLFKPEFAPAGFRCSCCGEIKPFPFSGGGTGYALNHQNEFVCYECCGKNDAEQLKADRKGHLYFCGDKVSNWPGTLSFPVHHRSYSFHNFAGRNGRCDFWFTAFGANWHGVCIGKHNQLSRVRQINGKLFHVFDNH